MNEMINNNYLATTCRLFKYYKSLGDQTFSQLRGVEDYYYQPSADVNSLFIIIKHLNGNMKSRFTDFMTSDGEKEWRHRDAEFESDMMTIPDIWSLWEEGWTCVFNAIDPLTPADLLSIVYIRHEGHTVLEALQRQLGHYAYHVGQMVHIGKILLGDKWVSISVPKGGSINYNNRKFSKEQRIKFFTEGIDDE